MQQYAARGPAQAPQSAEIATGRGRDRLADCRRRGCGRLRRRWGRRSGSARLTDVVCLERCADVREATVGSRVQLSGRGLDGVDEVRFAADGGGRVAASPSSVSGATVEVKVPAGAASGTVRARAYGTDAETPSDQPLKIVDRAQIPDRRPVQAHRRRGDPASDLLRREAGTAGLLHLPRRRHRPTCGSRSSNRETKEVVDTFIQDDAEPGTRNVAKWDGRTTDGAPAPGGDYKFRARQRGRRRAVATEDSSFGYHLYTFPARRPPHLRRRLRRGPRAHRARTCSRSAAHRSTPPAAAGCRRSTCQSAAGNYVVIDGKGTKSRHLLCPPDPPLASAGGRPGAHGPGDRQRGSDGQRFRLPPALRDLERRPAGTRAVTRCRASATCCTTGTAGAERRAPGRGRDPRGARRRVRPSRRGREASGRRVRARQGAGEAGDRLLRRQARGAGPLHVQGPPAA